MAIFGHFFLLHMQKALFFEFFVLCLACAHVRVTAHFLFFICFICHFRFGFIITITMSSNLASKKNVTLVTRQRNLVNQSLLSFLKVDHSKM